MAKQTLAKNTKHFRKDFRRLIVLVLVVICFFLCVTTVFLGSIFINMYNNNFYRVDFEQRTNERLLTKDLSNKYYNNTLVILDYLKNEKNEFLVLEGLSAREINHMVEVKEVVSYGFFILKIMLFAILIVVGLLYLLTQRKLEFSFREAIARILFFSGIFVIGIVIILALFALKFEIFWTNFHELIFKSDTWLLGSETLLIKMYPQEFFAKMAFRVFLTIAFLGSVFTYLGWQIGFKKEKHK